MSCLRWISETDGSSILDPYPTWSLIILGFSTRLNDTAAPYHNLRNKTNYQNRFFSFIFQTFYFGGLRVNSEIVNFKHKFYFKLKKIFSRNEFFVVYC